MSQAVDAVVIEYHLGLLDGAVVASEIKQVRPQVPIVMVCDNLELPEDALKSVDAIVVRSDGHHFLVATIHFVLSVEWEKQHNGASRAAAARRPFNRLGLDRPRRTTTSHARRSSTKGGDVPFPPRLWRRILDGTIQFWMPSVLPLRSRNEPQVLPAKHRTSENKNLRTRPDW
jgi:DNA-binding response OmpR family regulator